MPDQPHAIEYSTPKAPPPLGPAWRSYWLRIPIACWFLPLAAGLFIFIRVEMLRQPGVHLGDAFFTKVPHPELAPLRPLVDAGLVTLLIGTTLAFYGVISLIAFAMLRWPRAADRWRQVVRPALVVLALVLSNFAVAWGLAAIAFR